LNSFSIKIGGEAGQGLVSVGNILLQAISQEGWYLFSHRDYESRIRGGHNFTQFRLADEPVHTLEEAVDVLVALDKATIDRHRQELKEDGVVIYDPSVQGETIDEPGFVAVPFVEVAQDQGQPKVMANAAAAGAIWSLLGDDLERVNGIFAAMFSRKGEDIVEGNKKVAQAGFDRVRDALGHRDMPPKPANAGPQYLIAGNPALASGALAAGVKFMSAYPMTPSTGVTEFIAANGRRCSVIMEQAEDEIAAMNMVVGASYAGARAMTATSGGGFSLMTEAIGMAASAEVPVVVIDAQRPGPSTGLPTRTEQGDLLYGFGTASGDFPKAILAPGDVQEAFYLMGHAFNLADKYQMPVIVMSDQHLADSYETTIPLDMDKVTVDRGEIVSGDEAGTDYKRFALTESGVSPRLIPGSGPALTVAAGDEHDEEGHLVESAEARRAMMDKRMAKMKGVAEEALPPVLVGDDEPELVLISWGSTKGALFETVDKLQEKGQKVKGVHIKQVYPFSQDLEAVLQGPGKKVVVESNYVGQLEKLLGMEFAWKPDGCVRRYDGRPLNPDYILRELEGGGHLG